VRVREALPLMRLKELLSERLGVPKVSPLTAGMETVPVGSHCSKMRLSSLTWLSASVPELGCQRTDWA